MQTQLSTIYRLYQETGVSVKLKDYIYPDDTYGKDVLDNHRSVFVPLEMKNWIYRHSTKFLNYTSVLTNSLIVLGAPNEPRNLFPNINIF
jgi:hypothetical protein